MLRLIQPGVLERQSQRGAEPLDETHLRLREAVDAPGVVEITVRSRAPLDERHGRERPYDRRGPEGAGERHLDGRVVHDDGPLQLSADRAIASHCPDVSRSASGAGTPAEAT